MRDVEQRPSQSPYASRLRLCTREVVLAIVLTLGAVGLLLAAAGS